MPQGAVYAALGHYDMVTTQWLPFYALYLLKTLHSPRLKNAFLADSDGATGMQILAGDVTMMYYTTDEAKEGRNAFVEKRQPDFAKYTRLPFHG